MEPKSGLRIAAGVIGTTALLSANIAAELAPIPYLGPVVGSVLAILELCERVRINGQAVKELGQRCGQLLLALRNRTMNEDTESDPIKEMVDSCGQLVEEIEVRMKRWHETPKAKQFFLQGEIAEDIKRCNSAIDAFVETFQITASMELHNMMYQLRLSQDANHQEQISYLSNIENKSSIIESIATSTKEGVDKIMSLMQQNMTYYAVNDYRHSGLSENLLTIQHASGRLLPEIELKRGEVMRIGLGPVGGSTQFDIWEGRYLGRERCAIKALRGMDMNDRTRERLLREVKIWRTVWELDQGKYILPFYGALLEEGPFPCMVSPWMSNGDALTYVNRNPHVDRKFLIRRIAEGLSFLHHLNPPIAHGDIKALNILINDDGLPLLADFGLSKIMEEVTGMPFTQTKGVSDSYRWFAPELCCAPGIISRASDIFSFSMTVLELMTGLPPFFVIKRPTEVLIKLQGGFRPERPMSADVIQRGLDDKLWNLLTRCWVEAPDDRPTIDQVIEELP